MTKELLVVVLLLWPQLGNAQTTPTDTAKLDLQKIYSRCLDGDVKTALNLLRASDSSNLSVKDQQLKDRFEKRFNYATDQSDYLETRKSPITPLLTIYRDYWRESLLEHTNKYDTSFGRNLAGFLSEKFPGSKDSMANEDSIDVYLKKYIESNGLHTTGFGKTGQFLDLLVWKDQRDTTYTFSVNGEHTSAEVVFMDSFVTLGWEDYATLGRAYPGGWATQKALFCVKQAYELSSEEFLVSYLAHESRHFADYKLFPKLKSADLEYRAKLTELSMADTTLFRTLESFINNANYDSENGHSVANFCVVRDLSRALFHVEAEGDTAKWKEVPVKKIHASASEILRANTLALEKLGSSVEHYIK